MFSSLSKRILILLLIIWICTLINYSRWKDHHLIQWDIFQYYSYLPATFIKHDLSYKFLESEKDTHWNKLWVTPLPNGKKSMKMTMGLSFLYLPFFLTAHVIAGWFGYVRDGFNFPYQFMLAISSIFYAFIGIYIVRKLLLKYFNEVVTSITLMVLVLGTNLWSGTLLEIGLTHSYLMMLIAIFLYLTIKWLEKPTYKNIIAAGFTAGLITLIRPTDILVLIIPILFGISSIKNLRERVILFWEYKLHVIVFGVCMFIVFIPQIIHWKYISGEWILYSYGEERFYFLKPHILSGLFSYRKGWLLYTPIMTFALIGFFLLKKYARDFFWLTLIFTVLNSWIVFSWWCWWYGGSFGARALIESYALLVFPLAAFIRFAWQNRNWVAKTSLILVFGFFIWLNLFQSNQYKIRLLHWECTSKKLYWKIFATKEWPQDYKQLLKCPDLKQAEWEEESHIEKFPL